MGLFQVRGHDVGVNLRGPDVGMAQKLLDVPDAGPALEHLRGARVAQGMGRDAVRQVRFIPVHFHDPAQVGCAEMFAGGADKDQRRNILVQDNGPHVLDIFGQVSGRHPADRDNAVFLSLALQDADYPFGQVKVVERQTAQFAAPDSG